VQKWPRVSVGIGAKGSAYLGDNQCTLPQSYERPGIKGTSILSRNQMADTRFHPRKKLPELKVARYHCKVSQISQVRSGCVAKGV